MYKLLKMQYQIWKKITKDDVARAVKNGKITAAEYKKITGDEYVVTKGADE